MTMLWNPVARRIFLYRGIRDRLGTHAITIYGGVQPSAVDFAANWAASYTSANPNFLGHYPGAVWAMPDTNSDACSLTLPAAQNAVNSGTAAWGILWMANPLLAAMGGALPTTSFIVVPASASGGAGVIQFTSAVFTAAASKAILSGSILVGGT